MTKRDLPFNVNDPALQRLRRRYAERLDRFVIWVGSGPSTDAGIPTWAGLRQRLQNAAERKISSLAAGDSDKLWHTLSAVKTIPNHWQALERLQDILGQTTFREEVREVLNVPENVTTPLVYGCLWQLHVAGIMTTNLDRLVARAFAESRSSLCQ